MPVLLNSCTSFLLPTTRLYLNYIWHIFTHVWLICEYMAYLRIYGLSRTKKQPLDYAELKNS